MHLRFIAKLSVLVSLLTALSGCRDKPVSPNPAPPEREASLPPKVLAVTLEMSSENGPGRLLVEFDPRRQPGDKTLRPEWEALRGPLTRTGKEGEFSAPVDLDMKTVQSWFEEAAAKRTLLTWPDRFKKPLPITLAAAPPLQLAYPWQLKLAMDIRVRQIPLGYPIKKLKSLLLIDTDIVSDPCRTRDPALSSISPVTPAGNQYGIWTFHHLVTCLANEQFTGISASALTGRWLDTWATEQQPEGPGGNVAAARNPGASGLLTNWPRLNGTAAGATSTTDLDTTRAPFRLLAIVNRFDLRESSLYGSGGRAELRFVFCSVKTTNDSNAGHASDFLVIFEFGVPLPTFRKAHEYARAWAGLSDPALSRDDYRRKLSDLTESVVNPVPGSTRPNRSNLNQVRTEELEFGGPWEFREFVLDQTTHLLRSHTVAQTPDPWVNYGPEIHRVLPAWMNLNAEKIKEGRHLLPSLTSVLAYGQTNVPSGIPLRVRGAMAQEGGDTDWGNSGLYDDPEVRPAFIRNTCNGCHSKGSEFAFIKHISPRQSGERSQTSAFLFTEDDGVAGDDEVPEEDNVTDDLNQRLDKLQQAAEASPRLPFDELFLINVPQPH